MRTARGGTSLISMHFQACGADSEAQSMYSRQKIQESDLDIEFQLGAAE